MSVCRLIAFLRHPKTLPAQQNGLEAHGILLSLVLTLKRQVVDTLNFLKILLTKNTAFAQATLFNDSSWASTHSCRDAPRMSAFLCF